MKKLCPFEIFQKKQIFEYLPVGEQYLPVDKRNSGNFTQYLPVQIETERPTFYTKQCLPVGILMSIGRWSIPADFKTIPTGR